MATFDCNTMWTAWRRTLFALALLLLGAMTTHIRFCERAPGMGISPISGFLMGIDSIAAVLAIWLVTRADIWRSWNGKVRAGIYIMAYGYGTLLSVTVQDWWTAQDFRVPGYGIRDYAKLSIDLLSLTTSAWILAPVAFLTAMRLSTRADDDQHVNHFSIKTLIGFTTVAALILGWICFLTSELAPHSYYRRLSQTVAIREWLGTNVPFAIPPLIAAIVIIFGRTQRWWISLLVLLCAIAIDGVGNGIVVLLTGYNVSERLDLLVGFATIDTGYWTPYYANERLDGILGGANITYWLYFFGRSLTCWSAITIAGLTGIRPSIGIS